ncbi:MAG: hypothetical protein LCH62_18520 [Proteobacteria bacterium]|nr:hypothetical protein [Pseudomonadota bacterium]
MERPNFYAALPLDRKSELRRDDAFVISRLEHREARFVPVWRTRNLVHEGQAPQAVWLTRTRIEQVTAPVWQELLRNGDTAA